MIAAGFEALGAGLGAALGAGLEATLGAGFGVAGAGLEAAGLEAALGAGSDCGFDAPLGAAPVASLGDASDGGFGSEFAAGAAFGDAPGAGLVASGEPPRTGGLPRYRGMTTRWPSLSDAFSGF